MEDFEHEPPLLDRLQDAQAMARLYPATFDAPSAGELAQLNGDGRCWVKISRDRERFWVKVIAVFGERIVGYIDNDLVREANRHLKWHDIVACERRHCYDVHSP